MTKILHLTDTHVGKTKDEAKNLKLIRDKIVENYGDGEMVILVSGDLVDDGQKKQFAKARKIMDPLFSNPNFKVWTVPGNHDYGWNGTFNQARRFKYFKSAFYGPYENVCYPHIKTHNGHIFIGLNSLKAELGLTDRLLADGELGSKQLKNLNGVLNQLDGRDKNKKVIVHLHHHPFIFPEDIDDPIGNIYEVLAHQLKDGPALMHILSGRVDVIVFGHDHEQLDFSNTKISRQYKIPHILSGGKCTEYQDERRLNDKGKPKEIIHKDALMGRLIEIDDGNGDIAVETVIFDS